MDVLQARRRRPKNLKTALNLKRLNWHELNKFRETSEKNNTDGKYIFETLNGPVQFSPGPVWSIEVWAVQKHVNLVDLVKTFPTTI